MTENPGILKSFEVLGDKIMGLETELNYERFCKDKLTADVERLKEEKSSLENKLGNVENYIKKQAE